MAQLCTSMKCCYEPLHDFQDRHPMASDGEVAKTINGCDAKILVAGLGIKPVTLKNSEIFCCGKCWRGVIAEAMRQSDMGEVSRMVQSSA
eukprot:365917-Chlamydomonas_euryale.AAC.12